MKYITPALQSIMSQLDELSLSMANDALPMYTLLIRRLMDNIITNLIHINAHVRTPRPPDILTMLLILITPQVITLLHLMSLIRLQSFVDITLQDTFLYLQHHK